MISSALFAATQTSTSQHQQHKLSSLISSLYSVSTHGSLKPSSDQRFMITWNSFKTPQGKKSQWCEVACVSSTEAVAIDGVLDGRKESLGFFNFSPCFPPFHQYYKCNCSKYLTTTIFIHILRCYTLYPATRKPWKAFRQKTVSLCYGDDTLPCLVTLV